MAAPQEAQAECLTGRWQHRPALSGGRCLAAASTGNVAEAVRQVRPYAVDLSSGIEAAPGVKDPERLRALIAQIREADTRYR